MKFKLYIILVISIFSITSCSEVIELELDDPTPVLVVDGNISNLDTIQYVQLSNLENYFTTNGINFLVHKKSVVKLIENGTNVATYIFNDSTLRFETRYEGIIGNEYQIDILLEDGTRYISANELMEEVVPIDTIWSEFDEDQGDNSQRDPVTVLINTKEPVGLGDNYQWKTYVNGEYNNSSGDLFFTEDRFVDGQDILDFDVYGMDMDEYDTFKENSPNGTVYVTIEQSRISYRFYEYLFLVSQQLNDAAGPFASPPAQIRGNVYKQGENEVLALGYFHTSAISSKTTAIIE
jgi:hypothetical protein